MGNRADILDTGGDQSTQRKPPANVIVPVKRADQWDHTLSRLDSAAERIEQTQSVEQTRSAAREATLLMYGRKIDSMALWVVIRDIIVILMLAALCAYIGYRAMKFDSMQAVCMSMPQG